MCVHISVFMCVCVGGGGVAHSFIRFSVSNHGYNNGLRKNG